MGTYIYIFFSLFLGDYVETDPIALERQKQILQLFYRVIQHEHLHSDYEEIGKSFSIQEHADNYDVSCLFSFKF